MKTASILLAVRRRNGIHSGVAGRLPFGWILIRIHTGRASAFRSQTTTVTFRHAQHARNSPPRV